MKCYKFASLTLVRNVLQVDLFFQVHVFASKLKKTNIQLFGEGVNNTTHVIYHIKGEEGTCVEDLNKILIKSFLQSIIAINPS